MNELRVLDNELIPVYQSDRNEKLVNARELHEFLQSKQDFSTWIKNRIDKYVFVEGIDFSIILGKSTGGRPRTEYILTIEMAKELAMVENNERGRLARRYFIEIERRYKMDISKLSPQLQALNQIVMTLNQQEVRVNQLESRVKVIQTNLLPEHKDNWRDYVNKVLRKIGQKIGDYQKIRSDSYKELEKRACCNLKIRLDNLKGRALANDKPVTYVRKLNYLDILEDEPRLREIYLGIIREYAVKYEIEVA